jgi:hypothetical protein
MKLNATTIALLAVVAPQAMAEELVQVTPLNETLSEQALISGTIVAGFLSVGEATKEKPYLEAMIPEAWKGSLVCLSLVSQDGRYEALGEYSVQGPWSGEPIRVPLESLHNEYLSKTERSQFAGLLSKGSCDARGQTVTPVGWNEKLDRAPSKLELLINSRAADEVYLVFENSSDVDCVKTDSAVHLAFDFVCDIPKQVVDAGDVIEVNRIRKGRKDRPHIVQVSPLP